MKHTVIDRARASAGISCDPVYRLVIKALQSRKLPEHGKLLDVGCGTGALRTHVEELGLDYAGADVIRYEGFPADSAFYAVNLDAQRIELSDASMDIVVAAETIEHVENPRALVREMARLVKPGGVAVVTTPNNLSFLSKLTLVLKNQFNAFQDSCYPAHISALVETDLVRMMKENGLGDIRVLYSNRGRAPGTGLHWPSWLLRGRAFSDNILVSAVKPV